jgi:hypothetical protein
MGGNEMVRNVKFLGAVALLWLGSAYPGMTATLFTQTPPTIENSHYSDFDVPQITYTLISLAGASTIHDVTWRGSYILGDEQPAAVDNFRIALFQNAGGSVGTTVADVSAFNAVNRVSTGTEAFGRTVFEYSFDLNASVSAGSYWLAIINSTGSASSNWVWTGGSGVGGSDLIGVVFGPPAFPSSFPDTSRYVIVEGDVGASPSEVPLPPAAALFATVFLGLGWLARRRKKQPA